MHFLGKQNTAAEFLSWQCSHPAEWRLLPTAAVNITHFGEDPQGGTQSTSSSPKMAWESPVPNTKQTTGLAASLCGQTSFQSWGAKSGT